MEEEEKEGLSMCEIVSWFEKKEIKLNTEWLSAVLSHLGNTATIKGVFEQFVFSRLEESYERPMKIPDKAAKIVLTKTIIFQVIDVVNIARPIFEQLKDELSTENHLTWFYGEDTDEHQIGDEGSVNNECKGRQCAMVTVTDGATTLKAIDYGRVEGLNDDIPIGTKLMIVDRVMCRRGVMVLKRTNCTILGGAFEREENELSKAEKLSKMLPASKKSKIEPYLSRVKKEFDLNQRTISPFLRRIPPKDTTPIPTPSLLVPPLSHSPSCPPPVPVSPTRSIGNAIVSAAVSVPSSHHSPQSQFTSPIAMPPPIVPTRRHSPPRAVQSLLLPAAVVEPTVKIEEIDSDCDASVICIGKVADPLCGSSNRLNDSFNTSVLSNTRRILPIIPSAARMDMPSSQMDPLTHTRTDIPQPPCVKLTPLTLADRIAASQSRGRNRESLRQSAPSSSAGPKDCNRTIASYFQASKAGEPRWNRKTQMVEPSSRTESEAMRKEMEEGIEEGRRKEEEEKRMRIDRENREREERERYMRDEEERRNVYYEQMRRRDDEERKGREEEDLRRRSYTLNHPHQLSVVVVSTPAPCSYITPPSGYVTLPQSNEVHHHPLNGPPMAHPPTHRHSHPVRMSRPERHDSSEYNQLLFGGETRPCVPMNLFGSPARIHPSANHAVIPFKKTKVEEQNMSEKTNEIGIDGFGTKYGMSEERSDQLNRQSTHNPLQGIQHLLEMQGGMRSGYSTELQFPPSHMYKSSMCTRPSMEVSKGGGGMPSSSTDIQDRYLRLNPVSLKEVLRQRKFWMMPKMFHVVPLYTMIDRNLNIEMGLWDMKMKVNAGILNPNSPLGFVSFLNPRGGRSGIHFTPSFESERLWDSVVDESGEIFMCQLEHKLLEDLLGMSVETARCVRESNITQFHKFKDRGSKMFKSMERMDLVLDVEVTPLPKELPIITKIRTLPEVLSIF